MATRFWNFFTAVLTLPVRQSKFEVLLEVNLARQALGREALAALPRGECKKPGRCPVSLALHAYAGVDGVCVDTQREARILAAAWGTNWRAAANGKYLAHLPSALRGFIRDFDLGAYPELTATSRVITAMPDFIPSYRYNPSSTPVYAQ